MCSARSEACALNRLGAREGQSARAARATDEPPRRHDPREAGRPARGCGRPRRVGRCYALSSVRSARRHGLSRNGCGWRTGRCAGHRLLVTSATTCQAPRRAKAGSVGSTSPVARKSPPQSKARIRLRKSRPWPASSVRATELLTLCVARNPSGLQSAPESAGAEMCHECSSLPSTTLLSEMTGSIWCRAYHESAWW